MSKVTVIVATRNRPDFLFRCLLAIKLQTFEDFECIVVGDNCNFSEMVYREFEKDKRFSYYKFVGDRPVNQGSIAKNIALNNSKSKYVAYCDDDNILLPNHLELLYRAIDEDGADVAYSKFYHIDYDRAEAYDILNRDLYDIAGAKETRLNDALVMIHRLNDQRWVPKANLGNLHEDTYFMRQYLSFDIRTIDDMTAIYNQHNANDETKDHPNYKEALFSIEDRVYAYPWLVSKMKEKYWK